MLSMNKRKIKENIIKRKIMKATKEAKARQAKADVCWREILRQQARLAELIWCNNE